MNRHFRVMRKKYRLASLKELKGSTKRVIKADLEKAQMSETRRILSMSFLEYTNYEITRALLYHNYERANELHLLKNNYHD